VPDPRRYGGAASAAAHELSAAHGVLRVFLQLAVVGPLADPVVLQPAESDTCWSTMY